MSANSSSINVQERSHGLAPVTDASELVPGRVYWITYPKIRSVRSSEADSPAVSSRISNPSPFTDAINQRKHTKNTSDTGYRRHPVILLEYDQIENVALIAVAASHTPQSHGYIPWLHTQRQPRQPPHHITPSPSHAFLVHKGYVNFSHLLNFSVAFRREEVDGITIPGHGALWDFVVKVEEVGREEGGEGSGEEVESGKREEGIGGEGDKGDELGGEGEEAALHEDEEGEGWEYFEVAEEEIDKILMLFREYKKGVRYDEGGNPIQPTGNEGQGRGRGATRGRGRGRKGGSRMWSAAQTEELARMLREEEERPTLEELEGDALPKLMLEPMRVKRSGS
ncbi:hypothetical protein HDV00_001433 [Rhizophlyctis rosea]|nr:hypothetical protein HDV00_001433 [Rhizophlyctis rosea]